MELLLRDATATATVLLLDTFGVERIAFFKRGESTTEKLGVGDHYV